MTADQPELDRVQAQQPGVQLLGVKPWPRRRRGERLA
jgi:hypothetical protein